VGISRHTGRLVVAIALGSAAVAAVGSTAAGKPAGKHTARCATESKPKAEPAKRRARCEKGTVGTVAGVTSLLRGIPEEHERLGNPDAPLTLSYFGDLECPTCRYFTLNTLPTIIKEFVRPGKLKIEYHSFKSATAEPDIFKEQQVAALAAGQQDKMWYFVELFYHEQGQENTNYVNEGYLDGLARQVPGLNLTEWKAARSETNLAREVERDEQIGVNELWSSTPDFYLGDAASKYRFNPRSSSPSAFVTAIKVLLARAERLAKAAST
jgi:protein-disulfide isomerase